MLVVVAVGVVPVVLEFCRYRGSVVVGLLSWFHCGSVVVVVVCQKLEASVAHVLEFFELFR